MAIDLNRAPAEGEDENEPPLHEEPQAEQQFDLNINLDPLILEENQAGHQHEAPMHEEDLQAGHHFDLNMIPEDEHEAYVDPGAEDLHESDELDNDLEEHVGDFQSMEEELQAMHDALDDLQVDPEDYGVYAGDVEVQFEQEELDDSEPDEAMHDSEPDEAMHDSDPEVETNVEQEQANKYKNLTDLQRSAIFHELLVRSKNWKLGKNTTREVANMFHVSVYKVRRVWRRVKQCLREGIPVDVRSRKPKNCGRKRVEVDLSTVPDIPRSCRRTIRSLAGVLGVKKTTLHKIFTEGLLDRHSSTLKPYLKEANIKARLQFCISMFDPQSLQGRPTFKDMRNIFHLDEKWFNTSEKIMKFYKLPSEPEPNRTVQNKNSIGKVMFLVLLARPRYNAEGTCIFDGKIGIWPFIKKEPAPRRSDNRPRRTLITKTITVNRDTSREFLIQKVLPAIKAVWPQELAGETIWIQQDNAPSHVRSDDADFARAVRQIGLDVRLMQQPANSPDMNILDLGLFSSLQSMTDRLVSNNLDELIDNVKQQYDAYDADKINRVYLTLQSCLIEVMKIGGGNGYKIPHMYKDGLERAGNLPNVLSCDRELYESVVQKLST